MEKIKFQSTWSIEVEDRLKTLEDNLEWLNNLVNRDIGKLESMAKFIMSNTFPPNGIESMKVKYNSLQDLWDEQKDFNPPKEGDKETWSAFTYTEPTVKKVDNYINFREEESGKCPCEECKKPSVKEEDINLNRRKVEGCTCEGYCTKECDCKCHTTVKECEHSQHKPALIKDIKEAGYKNGFRINYMTEDMAKEMIDLLNSLYPNIKSDKIEEIISDFYKEFGDSMYSGHNKNIESWLRDKLKSF